MKRIFILFLTIILVSASFCACSCQEPAEPNDATPLPSPSQTAHVEQGLPSDSVLPNERDSFKINSNLVPPQLEKMPDAEPLVNVYVVQDQKLDVMGLESYLLGVLAGEMQNSWPLEALKAQAILARTYALMFIKDNGGSSYEGADVSTDIKEAQAYDAAGVNQRIKDAIEQTKGQVITHNNELIYAWFHSHAGGVTATAKEGLNWSENEPPYIHSIQIRESPEADEQAKKWSAHFPLTALQTALEPYNGKASEFAIEQRGNSGRVLTFSAGECIFIPAPELRLALGSTKMRSTLISGLTVTDTELLVQGSGYGHGVGMSQWGAYEMAQEGKTAQEIIDKFFKDVEICLAY